MLKHDRFQILNGGDGFLRHFPLFKIPLALLVKQKPKALLEVVVLSTTALSQPWLLSLSS